MKASELLLHLKEHIKQFGDNEIDIECEFVPFDLEICDVEPLSRTYDNRQKPYCTLNISRVL